LRSAKLILDLVQMESELCVEYRINEIQVIMTESPPPTKSVYERVDVLIVVSKSFQDIVDGFLTAVGELSNGSYRNM
jgi:hypothetical protein